MVGNSTQGIPHNPLVNKTVATLDARGPGARQSTVVPPMMVKKVRTTVYKVLNPLYTSVQAENENFSDPTFLEAFDLNFHMPGHFLL